MTDQEKIAALQEALKVAMRHWSGWLDEARGVTPWELMGKAAEEWNACDVLANAWTHQARGGIGG